LYVGEELGFFKQHGISLDIRLIESYDSRRAALAAGEIDIDHNTMDQLLIYAEAGVNARAFGISDFSTGGDGVIAKKTISTIEALKGKTVTFAEASPSEFLLRYILREHGMSMEDISPRPVADPQIAGTAVISGQVDAGVTFEPWLTQSKNNPDLHVLVSTSKYPKLVPGLFIARKDKIEERLGTYRSFMRAWYQSVAFFQEKPDKAKEIMQRRMNLSAQELDSILGTLEIIGKEGNAAAFQRRDPLNLFSLAEIIGAFWLDAGYVKRKHVGQSLVVDISEPSR
jgi:NitT/TauT family transport system substrate-binding protein